MRGGVALDKVFKPIHRDCVSEGIWLGRCVSAQVLPGHVHLPAKALAADEALEGPEGIHVLESGSCDDPFVSGVWDSCVTIWVVRLKQVLQSGLGHRYADLLVSEHGDPLYLEGCE